MSMEIKQEGAAVLQSYDLEIHSSVKKKKNLKLLSIESFSILVAIVLFGIPFYFVIINSFKDVTEAADMSLAWPSSFHILENYKQVVTTSNGMVLRAFFNSSLITVLSIITMILVCSMAAFVLQRRQGKGSNFLNSMVLIGLMIPPAIVPTIWVLQSIGLFKTLPGIVLLESALHFSFACMLYKAFMAAIPREIDEAALMDGCSSFKLYFKIILPLLKPVTSTIIVLSSINIYNDFENMLYFFPGAENATVQLTLYNFKGMFGTSWNLLFADVLLISIPPLILFIFFNKKIVAGMTAGAVKG
jgi:raffinose/stachyose/melibiose transport system permease protein